jgi:hypothetical protein
MRPRSFLITILFAFAVIAVPAGASAAPASALRLQVCDGFSAYNHSQENTRVTVPTAGPVDSRDRNCSLQLNDRGAGVLILQWALNRCHKAGLATDAICGPKTRDVILWAQAAAGFPPKDRDGIYGPKTQGILKWPWHDRDDNGFVRCSFVGFYTEPNVTSRSDL